MTRWPPPGSDRASGGGSTSSAIPTLRDTPEAVAHLGKRNIAMFSTDIDSFDFKLQPPDKLVQSVMEKLEKSYRPIIIPIPSKSMKMDRTGYLERLLQRALGYNIVLKR